MLQWERCSDCRAAEQRKRVDWAADVVHTPPHVRYVGEHVRPRVAIWQLWEVHITPQAARGGRTVCEYWGHEITGAKHVLGVHHRQASCLYIIRKIENQRPHDWHPIRLVRSLQPGNVREHRMSHVHHCDGYSACRLWVRVDLVWSGV